MIFRPLLPWSFYSPFEPLPGLLAVAEFVVLGLSFEPSVSMPQAIRGMRPAGPTYLK